MYLSVWLAVPLIVWGIAGVMALILCLLFLTDDWLDNRAIDNLAARVTTNAAYTDHWSPQVPPLVEEEVIRYLTEAELHDQTRSLTMSKSTATVASLVAALQGKAKEFGVSEATLNAFLKDNGVGTTEKHTVTITASGDTFAEVRDRAVRIVSTYGPGYPESGFPVTSDGVTFEHGVEVSVTA